MFLYLALQTPVEARGVFFILMALTALFMPFSSPNVISTVYDVVVPEVRSAAQAVEYFIENSGAAFAPVLAGIIADAFDMGTSILWVSIGAWAVCFCFYLGTLFFIDGDIAALRARMARRGAVERAGEGAQGLLYKADSGRGGRLVEGGWRDACGGRTG